MGKSLSRVDVDVIYLDDIFRSKEFDYIDDIKDLYWFKIAEVLEKFSESVNLRIVIIKTNKDYKYTNEYIDDKKYAIVQEIIASFDDEATLIITNDNTAFEDRYNMINMYPISTKGNILTYVYENAAGSFILDEMFDIESELAVEEGEE